MKTFVKGIIGLLLYLFNPLPVLGQSENTYVPGYMISDSTNLNYDYMGAVTFTSAYRFVTSYTNTTGPADWKGGRLNSEERRIVGFSIPYVVDLNHDGKPEIIAIGQSDGGSELHGNFRYVYIYNGQTGMEIARLPFTNENGNAVYFNTSGGYHVSPSVAAFVDSDRDGTIEIICAFPRAGSGTNNSLLISRVVSYDIEPFGPTYRLIYNWKSAQKYISNTGGNDASTEYQRASPQVCDLNGDGVPEVLVYNKIYNAQTGALLIELETMTTAHMGCNLNAPGGGTNRDKYIAFPYIYDMNLDGIYDIVAGGKIYLIKENPAGKPVLDRIVRMTGVNDGYTGVADINGDGKADVVTVNRAGNSNTSDVVISVWNPDFDQNGENEAPKLVAPQLSVKLASSGANSTGSNSYVFIGDIDGRVQNHGGNAYRLPEIAVLTRRVDVAQFPRHTTISGISDTNGGIPATYNWSSPAAEGCIFAVTYDPAYGNLRGSFIMEHDDSSINTGFTMFDFDNDGIQEICYRDELTLRVIKPKIPFIKKGYTNSSRPDIILFSKSVQSYTGFEYPVIADIDGDASAEMVVIGHQNGSLAFGYVYALGTDGDKFAPALPIWNQYAYDPFKIKPDSCTTPIGRAINRLASQYTYNRLIKNEAGDVTGVIPDHKPYNATLNQVPNYILVEQEHEGQNYDKVYEPIVHLPEAYIVSETDPVAGRRPKINVQNPLANSYIELTIGNNTSAQVALSTNTPISVYKNAISRSSRVKKVRLDDSSIKNVNGNSVNNAIMPGDTIRIRIPIAEPYETYYIRLGDNSEVVNSQWEWKFGTNNGAKPGSIANSRSNPPADPRDGYGIGVSSRPFRDTDWTNQMVKVSIAGLNPDAVTIQAFGTVIIPVLANDDVPDNFPTKQSGFVMNHSHIRGSGPTAGTINFIGSGVNTKILYNHNGQIPPTNIDTFSYAFTYSPGPGIPGKQFWANVYVYILQSDSAGFGACYGNNFRTKLKRNPSDVWFSWTDHQGNDIDPQTTDSATIAFGTITTPVTYTVKPNLPLWNGEKLDFIPGELTISALGSSLHTATMKWTGAMNTNWHNALNWVEIKEGKEVSVLFVPTACVNVIIPSGLRNYPQLTSEAACAKITLKDRAMIGNVDLLTYDNVEVELTLKPSERDRFVMWSPPLQDMYTGDYHFTKTAGGTDYYWGDVSMNFFQVANPDAIHWTPHKDMFTATFGNIWTKLLPGQAFNLKVIATADNQSQSFIFPRTNPQYKDTNGKFGIGGSVETFTRPTNARFMSDAIKEAGNMIPVRGNINNANYIQVVNPYMAYLNVRTFLTENSSQIKNQYKLWNGTTNKYGQSVAGDLITVQPDKTDGNRYKIDNLDMLVNPTNAALIPPLQSFFIEKATGVTSISSLKMRSSWTTVEPNEPGDYQLKADMKETNTLRIKATRGQTTSATLLFYHPEASPHYDGGEDAHKLFYADAPVAVYSFSPANDPLAINTSNDFTSHPTRLGVRLKEAGQVSFDFSGLETFGHDVFLIDHAQNNKETNVKTNPKYTFTVTKPSAGDTFIELNDRFSLRMNYTGIGVGDEAVSPARLHTSSGNGFIRVQAGSSTISSLQIYTISGALVYSSNKRSEEFHVAVNGQQTYLVKAKTGADYTVEKVFVK